MLVNHKEKRIVAYQWERFMVCNFIAHCIKPDEKSGWSVEFLEGNQKQEDILFGGKAKESPAEAQ